LDSANRIDTVSFDLDQRIAHVFAIRPDGSAVTESVPLSEAVLGHLGGGEMVQIKFSDGNESRKIEPLYIQPPDNSPTSRDNPPDNAPTSHESLLAVTGVTVAVVFILAGALFYWRRARTAKS
jgi:hypothetical protein